MNFELITKNSSDNNFLNFLTTFTKENHNLKIGELVIVICILLILVLQYSKSIFELLRVR